MTLSYIFFIIYLNLFLIRAYNFNHFILYLIFLFIFIFIAFDSSYKFEIATEHCCDKSQNLRYHRKYRFKSESAVKNNDNSCMVTTCRPTHKTICRPTFTL